MAKRNPLGLLVLVLAYLPAGYATSLAMQQAARHPHGPRIESGRAVSAKEQKETAYHEGAHALVNVYLFGPEFVGDLRVWTKTDDSGFLGTVGWSKDPPSETADDFLRRAAVFMAGRAADKLMLGAPTSGSRVDLERATGFMMPIRIAYGLGGALVVKPSPSDRDYEAVDKMLKRANECAEAIVVTNQDAIKSLADLALAQRVNGRIRTLPASQIREFFKGHPFKPPMFSVSVIETGDDPCDFRAEL